MTNLDNLKLNIVSDEVIQNYPSDEIEKAWKIFGEMYKNQINPDNFTLSTLFRGIKTMDHYDYLIKGINLVKQRKDKIDIILINVLLDACIKLKDSKDFLELFDSLINGKFSNNDDTTDEGTSTTSDIKPDTNIKKAGFADILILSIIILIYIAIIVNLVTKLK